VGWAGLVGWCGGLSAFLTHKTSSPSIFEVVSQRLFVGVWEGDKVVLAVVIGEIKPSFRRLVSVAATKPTKRPFAQSPPPLLFRCPHFHFAFRSSPCRDRKPQMLFSVLPKFLSTFATMAGISHLSDIQIDASATEKMCPQTARG